MYTPHTVTLVNCIEGADYAMQYHKTVLRGVMLQASKRANVNKSGLIDADAVTLFIPFSVNAGGKKYVKPKAFEALEDKSKAWTIRKNGTSSACDCYFVKGEIPTGVSYADALQTYDDVYRVTSVDVRDFGSPSMQHWQVGGI